MVSTIRVSSMDRRPGSLLALSLLLLPAVCLVSPAEALGDAVHQPMADVQISDRSVTSLTVTEDELLPRFPEVEGANLEKQDFRLPEDFEGEANLVFLAFRRPQQAEFESWLPFAKELVESHRGLRFYQLPIISIRGGMARYFINEGMRRGIPDQKAREVTITLYLEKEPFLQALDIPDEDSIYILLVGKEGRIHWRAMGSMTEESAAGLERAVTRRLQATVTVARYDPGNSRLGYLPGLE